jgi:hypothetical protein
MAAKKALRQTTLDGKAYVERNRLGQEVKRAPMNPGDYTLCVFGAQDLDDEAWVHAQLDDVVARDRRGRFPVQVICPYAGRGVPVAAESWAVARGLAARAVTADDYLVKWPRNEFDRLAYLRRDEDLIDLADVVVALWRKEQRMTPAVVAWADNLGKLARNVSYEKRQEADDE